MHPAFYRWWRAQHEDRCGVGAGCGPSGEHGWESGYRAAPFGGDYGGGPFGVRRPLRYLAHKLELDDAHVEQLAAILNDLKTERAQADVDERRTTAAFADVVSGATFDGSKAAEAGAQRVKTAERLRDAVVRALGRIHAMLNDEQRAKLAYLIRTGALAI